MDYYCGWKSVVMQSFINIGARREMCCLHVVVRKEFNNLPEGMAVTVPC